MDNLGAVLILRDSPVTGDSSCDLWRKKDCRLLTASGYEKSIEAAEKVRPEFIFLDVAVPEPNGLKLLRALKVNPATRDIPVIIVSSLPELELVRLLDEGAFAFCHRTSLTPKVLESVIKQSSKTCKHRSDAAT